MRRNAPAKKIEYWEICMAIPGGGVTLHVAIEPRHYNSDPDGWAAEYVGLSSKADYYEWLDCNGTPLCGCVTREGQPCKNATGGSQLAASVWKHLHRARMCKAHCG